MNIIFSVIKHVDMTSKITVCDYPPLCSDHQHHHLNPNDHLLIDTISNNSEELPCLLRLPSTLALADSLQALDSFSLLGKGNCFIVLR